MKVEKEFTLLDQPLYILRKTGKWYIKLRDRTCNIFQFSRNNPRYRRTKRKISEQPYDFLGEQEIPAETSLRR